MAKFNKNHRIIATNNTDIEDYKDDFKEWCEYNGLNPEEEDIYEYMAEEHTIWLNDERLNLKKVSCGTILAIADLGLWDGRHTAYRLLSGGNASEIFRVGHDCNYYDFYCDRYNVRADFTHHDGTNHIEFREVREGREKALKKLCEALYNQEEVTREQINYCTRSLRKKVSAVYGW